MRIVVCDDHSIFAEALAVVLQSHGHDVVACVANPDEAVAVVASNEVDVCIMDLTFPLGSGVDGTTRVLEASPGTRVVLLTGSQDLAELTGAVGAGAHGLATKSQDLARIIEVLDRVLAGEIVLDVLRSFAGREEPALGKDHHFLTQREREVLGHLAKGESTADLARAMGIRYSTARTHIQSALTKLGVHSKLEAVVFAVSNNLVPPPGANAPSRDTSPPART